MKLNGTVYKPGSCVIRKFTDDIPVFVKIRSVLFVPGDVLPIMVGDVLQTLNYNGHFHAYKVELKSESTVIIFRQSDLVNHHILSL